MLAILPIDALIGLVLWFFGSLVRWFFAGGPLTARADQTVGSLALIHRVVYSQSFGDYGIVWRPVFVQCLVLLSAIIII